MNAKAYAEPHAFTPNREDRCWECGYTEDSWVHDVPEQEDAVDNLHRALWHQQEQERSPQPCGLVML
jgi:hypothetical protein